MLTVYHYTNLPDTLNTRFVTLNVQYFPFRQNTPIRASTTNGTENNVKGSSARVLG